MTSSQSIIPVSGDIDILEAIRRRKYYESKIKLETDEFRIIFKPKAFEPIGKKIELTNETMIADSEYYSLTLAIKHFNPTPIERSIYTKIFRLVDKDGYIHPAASQYVWTIPDKDGDYVGHVKPISPNIELLGRIWYDLPKDAAPFKIRLKTQFLKANTEKRVKLPIERFEQLEQRYGIYLRGVSAYYDLVNERFMVYSEVIALNGSSIQQDLELKFVAYTEEDDILYTYTFNIREDDFDGIKILDGTEYYAPIRPAKVRVFPIGK
ncbi:hypothetical protein E308F_16260 [Moorella sp. E308F]|uniref:hypothetical protein n=1 Tax=unclassified Neomoorella TaxID=2676739 RepID=UPI0010FFAACD|nr:MULTISPECIES: hypothetical protein [unclassified Moorella (in: firmicutes)]GEA15382.1 hypothetical protein E308F_16260 [Moorella sp. E308F]GEA19757.1 hypothetical protein E306M_28960 [Moorella sp. E306M]